MDLNPSAARSLGEGLEETLTVHRLHVPPQLRKTLASTNVIESAFSIVERVCCQREALAWQGISVSAGWGPGCWWRRSNSAGSRDTNRFPSFSENWKRWFRPSRRLSNGGRRRKVGYARAATFNGKSGDSLLTAVLKNPVITVHTPDRAGWMTLAAESIQPALITVLPHALLSWLPLVAGRAILAARRLGLGFQWFNSKVDIEHKPLSSIGLVAGAMVAVLWWTVVVVRWVV